MAPQSAAPPRNPKRNATCFSRQTRASRGRLAVPKSGSLVTMVRYGTGVDALSVAVSLVQTLEPKPTEISNKTTEILFDVGCNKGYESTLMFQLFSPASQLAPVNTYAVHQEQGRGLDGNLCGACDNCHERLEANRDASLPTPNVHVYCFEVCGVIGCRYAMRLSASTHHQHIHSPH